MTWDPTTDPCDYILLKQQKSPGIARVIGPWNDREYKKRQPPFTTGAVFVFCRTNLAQFEVRFDLYTTEDHIEWGKWRKIVDETPDIRKQAKGIDIWHPSLQDLKIKSVVVKAVSGIEEVGDGVWRYTVKFEQYIPVPKMTLSKVEGSAATPVDPVDQQIEALTKQAQALAAQ